MFDVVQVAPIMSGDDHSDLLNAHRGATLSVRNTIFQRPNEMTR